MTNFAQAVKKVMKRRRRNGYYEAGDILTNREKHTLITVTASIVIPLLISTAILFVG